MRNQMKKFYKQISLSVFLLFMGVTMSSYSQNLVCTGKSYQQAITYNEMSSLQHRFEKLWLGDWHVKTFQEQADYGANSIRFNSDLNKSKKKQLTKFSFSGETTQQYILGKSATYAKTFTHLKFYTRDNQFKVQNSEVGITRFYPHNLLKMWIFDGNGNQLICCGGVSYLGRNTMLVPYTCGLNTRNLKQNVHQTLEFEKIMINSNRDKGIMLDYRSRKLKHAYQETYLEKL